MINSASAANYADATISALLTSSVIEADPVTRSIVRPIKGFSEFRRPAVIGIERSEDDTGSGWRQLFMEIQNAEAAF